MTRMLNIRIFVLSVRGIIMIRRDRNVTGLNALNARNGCMIFVVKTAPLAKNARE